MSLGQYKTKKIIYSDIKELYVAISLYSNLAI